MEIETLAEGFLGANCYLLKSGGHAFLVDPSARLDIMYAAVYDNALSLDGILLTHGHFDHIMNLAPLLERLSAPVYLGEGDKDFPADGRKNAFSVFFGQARTFPPATHLLHDGDTLTLGDETLTVISTPGHSGGSVCFLAEGSSILVTGDTLFADTVGRTDLYGGNSAALRESLLELARLSEKYPDLRIYPGHGLSERLSDALRLVL